MRRYGVPTAIVLATAIVGCGPGKEMPVEVIQPETAPAVAPDPLGPAPDKSDPDAQAVVDRAVKAISQGDSSRLARAKNCVTVFTGGMLVGSPILMDATRQWEVAYPDRAHVAVTFKGQPEKAEFWLKDGRGSANTPGPQDPSELARIMTTDLTAQLWTITGPALTHPRVVAFQVEKSANDAPAGTVVRLSWPDMPVVRILFDEKTGLPIRLDYNPVESGRRVHKLLTMSDHKPHADLMLPTAFELIQAGKSVEKWTQVKWDFPDKLDPAVFDAPR